MESIENLFPDGKGNFLVVLLNFYDDIDKSDIFQIPKELANFEIADINIQKLHLNKPLGTKAFHSMCHWLIEQFCIFPNVVFTYICSISDLERRNERFSPEEYRWKLFESLWKRVQSRLHGLDINTSNIIVGPTDYQTYAKIFYRNRHNAVVKIVEAHLQQKLN